MPEFRLKKSVSRVQKTNLNFFRSNLRIIGKFRLATKATSFFLIFALLFPLIFFGDWSRSAAQIRPFLPSGNNATMPKAKPPLSYKFADSNIFSTLSNSNLAFAIWDSASAINEFFTPEQMPNGFEIARKPSQFSVMVSSVFSSAGSVFDSVFNWLFSSETVSTSTATNTAPLTVTSSVEFDYDGDSMADLSVFQPSLGEWKIKNSGGAPITYHTQGISNSTIVPGDYDGDGKTDMAVFDAGVWTIKPSSGGAQYTIGWGLLGDKPVVGDYDGDGESDAAIFRPSTNTWWILHSGNGSYTSVVFGTSSDVLVPGDYDGDGKTDPAYFTPSTGDWTVKNSSNGATTLYHWGIASDTPVPGDYDGDGKTDYAVYRPTTGTWYATKSGGAHIQVAWGNYGDQPVAADFDGDGKTDVAVWRPKTGTWYVIRSSDGSFLIEAFGVTGDIPTESAYLKQIGGAVQEYDFAKLRLSPKEATGGTDLYSQNFAWGTGLVGLPGRAGLDAGFGI